MPNNQFDVNIDRPELNAEFDTRYPGAGQETIHHEIRMSDASDPTRIYKLTITDGILNVQEVTS